MKNKRHRQLKYLNITKDFLIQQYYINDLEIKEMAKYAGCSYYVMRNYMVRFGITQNGAICYRNSNGEKRCNVCKQWKSESDFRKSIRSADKLYRSCRQCSLNKLTYVKRKEKVNNINRQNRKIVIGYYSNNEFKCKLCGCEIYAVLTIDHINNDGNVHRRETKIKTGGQTYNWLIKHNFPKGFRVLCLNCNYLEYLKHK